jgi:hypothetical protein
MAILMRQDDDRTQEQFENALGFSTVPSEILITG